MSFSVASYNVLADAYINPRWYPDTPASILDPAWRELALVQRVVNLAADVICLQEVEPQRFAAMQDRLRQLGYEGRYAGKSGGKPDGCATFIRTITTQAFSAPDNDMEPMWSAGDHRRGSRR